MSRCVFDEAFTRKMGYLTGGDGRVGVSRGGRFVLGRKERSVGLWRVLGDEAGWEKVLEMDLRVSDILLNQRRAWRKMQRLGMELINSFEQTLSPPQSQKTGTT